MAETLAGEHGERADHVAGEPVRIAGRFQARDQGGERRVVVLAESRGGKPPKADKNFFDKIRKTFGG